jgi:RND superfamily putative drug exporter
MVIGMGLGISFALVYFLGTYFLDIHYSVLTILLTASLGAGCDYCIFILSRYREERRKGYDKKAAVETSVTWAGEAIATSGLTVIIAFGALSLSSMSYVRSMGVLAVGIACALLLALTLLPSILVLLGDRIFWPSRFDRAERTNRESYFTRSARFAIKYAKVLLLVAVVITIPTTYIVLTTPTSYDYISSMPDSESKEGLVVLEDGFGGGRIIPTDVGMDLITSVYDATGHWNVTNLDAIEGLCQELADMENVEEVISPTRPYGEPIDYANVSGNMTIEAVLYDQYMRTMVGENSTAVLIKVIFQEEPFSSNSIVSINTIRDIVDTSVSSSDVFQAGYVAGGTASMYDITVESDNDFLLIISVVIASIYIVLLLVLGSVLNPLRSILTILLSISWTLAVTMVLFTYVFEQPIMYMVPLMLLVVCLGLGMDYDILLSTRVREEAAKGKDTNSSIVQAVGQTGGVITACGLIMAGAFGTMMLSQGWLLREFGFALMFAILLDAMIVRIYLVPAIMSLLGRWNWWAPGRLQRTKIRARAPEEDDWIKKALEEER